MTEAELEEIRALGHLGMKPGACSGGEGHRPERPLGSQSRVGWIRT